MAILRLTALSRAFAYSRHALSSRDQFRSAWQNCAGLSARRPERSLYLALRPLQDALYITPLRWSKPRPSGGRRNALAAEDRANREQPLPPGADVLVIVHEFERALAQLEQRKLISRRANRADLREAFLALTPAGRALYEELAPSALDFMDRLFSVVAPADRPAFDRAIKQLTRRSAELVAEIERGKV